MLVENGQMALWRVGDKWPPMEEQVIAVGVATWSTYDMELVDLLETRLAQTAVKERIYLISTSFLSLTLKLFYPGSARSTIRQYSAVGTTVDSRKNCRALGPRDWLRRRFQLPPIHIFNSGIEAR